MQISSKQRSFLESEEGMKIKRALHLMESDSMYSTKASYSANVNTYPDHLIPFVDKHMQYLSEHQNIEPEQYLSNLRLMTKIK